MTSSFTTICIRSSHGRTFDSTYPSWNFRIAIHYYLWHTFVTTHLSLILLGGCGTTLVMFANNLRQNLNMRGEYHCNLHIFIVVKRSLCGTTYCLMVLCTITYEIVYVTPRMFLIISHPKLEFSVLVYCPHCTHICIYTGVNIITSDKVHILKICFISRSMKFSEIWQIGWILFSQPWHKDPGLNLDPAANGSCLYLYQELCCYIKFCIKNFHVV